MTIARVSDILVADNDAQVRRQIRSALEGAGYTAREAESGRIALGEVALHAPDLVVLAFTLPDTPGTEVIRALRQLSPVPVLVLSELGDEKTKIAALDAGADDFLTKPPSDGEFLAHIRALLRRTQPAPAIETSVKFGDIEVDLDRGLVLRGSRQVKLTAMEFKLLRMLIMHRDKVLTHHHILSELWGPRATNNKNYLRIYIMHLRRKLGEAGDQSGHFQTESGVGYRFVSDLPLGGTAQPSA